MTFVRLLESDATLEQFQTNWSRQCEEIGEDFENYATDSLIPIMELARNPQPESWAVSIQEDGRHTAAFIVHKALQKGFDAPVLRVRHIVVCPMLDQGVLSEETYADTLVALLFEAIHLSVNTLPASYIKMHVRSPADLAYFRALVSALDRRRVFESTELKGAWLTLKKWPGEPWTGMVL